MNVFQLEASLKLNTKDYEKSLKDAEKNAQEMSKSLDELDKAADSTQSGLDEAKKALEDVSGAADEAKVSIGDFTEVTESVKSGGFSKELDDQAASLQNEKSELSDTGKVLKDYADNQGEAADKTNKNGEAVDALADIIAASGVQQAISKISEELMECIEVSETFETSIAKLSTIAGTDGIDDMSQDILDLSSATGIAASDLANTAYNAISAGTAVSDAVGMAETASKLAIAGFTDTDSALSVLTTAINAYGDAAGSATDVADGLIIVQNLGVTTVADLAANMGKLIATGSAYSVNLHNLESAYISTTKAGINTAESTTYISGMINELGKSTSTVSKTIVEETGKTFGQLMNSGYSLADVLQILYESAGNDTEALMNLWGSAEAAKAASAILNQGISTFNNNLKTLETSTGITEDAYKTMADTGEMSGKKLSNSITNLKIAIGDQLSPVLENVRSVGGDVIEKVTDWVEKNPEAVKAITGAVAALGALVAVITGVSAATAIATTVTKKLNTAMMANPAGLVATALAGVVAAFTAFVAIAGNATDAEESVADEALEMKEALSEASEALDTSMNDIKTAFDDSSASAQVTASMARDAAKELSALASQTSLTAEEQTREAQLVAELNTLYPEMGLEIDSMTGKLNMATDEISNYIDNMEKMGMVEAYSRAAADSYDAVVEAETELKQAQEKREDTTNELYKLEQKREELLSKQTSTQLGLNGSIYDYNEELNDIERQIRDTQDAEKALGDEVVTAQQKVDEAKEVAAGYTEQYAELETQVQNTTDATNAAAEATTAAAEAQTAAAEVIQTTIDNLKSNLESPLGSTWFDALPDRVETSSAQMVENLNAQLDEIATWEANLATLAEKNINEGLLQYLADMGPEGAGYVAALVEDINNNAGTGLDQLNTLWETKMSISDLTNTEGQNLVASLQSSLGQTVSSVAVSASKVQSTVSSSISSINGTLASNPFQMRFTVPTFDVSTGDASKGVAPKVTVSGYTTYAAAMHKAALLTTATEFAPNRIAGEAGNEFVVGENHLQNIVNESGKAEEHNIMVLISILKQYLPLIAENKDVYLDGKKVSSEIYEQINNKINASAKFKNYMRGVR